MATTTERVQVFDPGLAREVWPAAEFWQNPGYPYCRFIFRTPANGMRLEVGINYYPGSSVSINLHLATLSCGPIYSSPPRHQVPAVMHLWNIEKVKYDKEHGIIEFCQAGTPSGKRRVTICADGRFAVGMH